MADILGNNNIKGGSYLNLYSSSELSALQDDIDNAQAEVTHITKELQKCTDQYNYCKGKGAFFSCKRNTGKKESLWKWYINSYTKELKTAKSVLVNAEKAYDNAIASNKAESEVREVEAKMGKAEAEMDAETAKEWGEKGKSFGIWAVIILGLGFGGVMIYKKVKK